MEVEVGGADMTLSLAEAALNPPAPPNSISKSAHSQEMRYLELIE